MQNISVREIRDEEFVEALSLVWFVFLQYEAPDYSQEGIDEFYMKIHDFDYLSSLRVFGAFGDGKLVGVIATRNEGTHIALFFVNGKYHRQGIGKQLFQTVLSNTLSDTITVNSSPYAVPVYHKLGFRDIDQEQVVSGIRFTPMEYVR